MVAPLRDPRYVPQHPPVNGQIPPIVAKWGPRSQRRWFQRFQRELKPQAPTVWDRYYCSSLEHRGSCCVSCVDEEYELGWPNYDDHCCCYGYDAAQETTTPENTK